MVNIEINSDHFIEVVSRTENRAIAPYYDYTDIQILSNKAELIQHVIH